MPSISHAEEFCAIGAILTGLGHDNLANVADGVEDNQKTPLLKLVLSKLSLHLKMYSSQVTI